MDDHTCKKENLIIKQLFKYGFVTIISYILLFSGTFLLTEFFNIKENLSYLVTITLVYLFTYISNVFFVFNSKFSLNNLAKYIIILFIFWGVNNTIFNLLTQILEINYLLAILINILFFGLIRFFIQKKYIFGI